MLVAKAEAGNEDALSTLLEYCEPKFRIVARVSLGPYLRAQLDSIDLVQSVKRCLLPGIRNGKYDISTPNNLVALAATMIRRKVAEQWRRRKRQKTFDPTDHAQEPIRNVTDEPNDVGLVDNAEYVGWLLRLEELDPLDRRLLELRAAGLSTADAARQIGVPGGALRARLSRLRKALREKCGDDWQ